MRERWELPQSQLGVEVVRVEIFPTTYLIHGHLACKFSIALTSNRYVLFIKISVAIHNTWCTSFCEFWEFRNLANTILVILRWESSES